jgi:hypothetical protein
MSSSLENIFLGPLDKLFSKALRLWWQTAVNREGVIYVIARSEVQVGIRMTREEKQALQRDAKRSKWSLSDQIRYELFKPRGMWQDVTPYMPGSGAPGRKTT